MGPFAMAISPASTSAGRPRRRKRIETIRDVLCEMDRCGQKNGAGFYDYDEKRNAKPSPVVEKIIDDFAAKQGVDRRARSATRRSSSARIYPMVNEGAKILEEGMAQRASDIDVVWVNGYGWPVYRGGPMFYADLVGPDKVLAKMKDFEATMGDDFKPAPLLEKLVAEKKQLQDL